MAASTRLSKAIDEWGRAMKGESAQGTITSRMSVMRQFLQITGDLYVSSISAKHVDQFFTAFSHWQPGTRNKNRLVLNGFFNWCRDRRGYIDKTQDPMRGRRKPAMSKKRHSFISREQLHEMLDLAKDPRNRILLAMQYYLCIRISEVMPIQWRDFSKDFKRVLVRRKKKRGGAIVEDTLPVRGILRQELRKWMVEVCRSEGVARPDPNWYVVCPKMVYGRPRKANGHYMKFDERRYTPDRKLGVDGSRRIVKLALKEIGIEVKGEASHVMRRSGLVLIRNEGDQRGVNGLRVAQLMAGHEDEAMTQAYLDEDSDRDVRDAIIETMDDDEGPTADPHEAEVYAFPGRKVSNGS